MSTDNHSVPPTNQLQESMGEISRRAADLVSETAKRATATAKDATGMVEDVTAATGDAARRAGDTAKDMYRSAKQKAGDTLATSKKYVRRNPVPAVLGAIAFGTAIGYMLMMTRRKPTFGEQYADEPLVAVREAILGALDPVTQRVHKGYDSARDGAGKGMDRVHRLGHGRYVDSLSGRIVRIGKNIKFW